MTNHSWRDPHVIRAGKSLSKTLFCTLGAFLLLFVAFHISGALYVSRIATTAAENFQAGIIRDLSYLKKHGDEVANNHLIQEHLLAGDREALSEVLQTERRQREIGSMGVADSDGVILSRTKSAGVIGDNVFLANPVARVVAQGKSAESVEAPIGFSPEQLFLNTGRPIMREGRMIGALFASYLTDDAYALRFQDTYLPRGVKVAFYNKEGGIYGSSFRDQATLKLVKSYFNSGSEFIKDGISGKTISFDSDSLYLVENIVFPGLEKSPGGALLFIPRSDLSQIATYTTALLTLLVFILFTLHHHARSREEERGWRYYALLLLGSILVFALTLFGLQINKTSYLKLERVPYPLYNSTIRLQPEQGIYDLEFEQRIAVIVDAGDERVNIVQIGLTFNPDAVEIKDLETEDSACSYVIEKIVDSRLDIAKLTCALFQTGGESGSFKIADVVVKPKRTGSFVLAFDKEETKVLASDGLGTDVLRMSQSGSYTIGKFDPSLFSASSTSNTASQSFIIFSVSHPNQSRWYNLDTAHFVWKGTPDSVYRYTFDHSPNTIPSNARTLQGSEVRVPIPGDGIFYFHLQLASGGPVAHYRIQADRTPPSIVSISLSENRITAGDVVRVSFDGEDIGSGIQNNYYVDLGNRLFLPIGSQLFIPFLRAGDQEITLRVYDNAGNYSEKSSIIHVKAP